MRVWILLATCVFACASAVSAQTAGTVRLRHIGLGDGLPSPRVFSITQDSLGFLWVGTNDGVARYDGVRFDVWQEGEGGLPSNVVYAVHADATGAVWAATEGGLARLTRAADRFEEVAEAALDSLGVTAVRFLDSDAGGLWLSAREGAIHLRPDGTVRRVFQGGPTASPMVRVGEAVWLRDCNLTLTTDTCRPAQTDGPETAPRAGWIEDGALRAVLTDGRVVRVDGRERRLVTRWPLDVVGRSSQTLVTPGRAWLGSESGLRLYLPARDTVVAIEREAGLVGRDVMALFEDRQGGVWIGTEQGLHRWTPPRSGFHAVTTAEGLGDGRVNGLTTLGDDVWVATNGGLFRRRADGSVEGYRTGSDLNQSAIWRVSPAEGGGLWLGSKRSGMWRFWPETGRTEPADLLNQTLGSALQVQNSLPIRDIVERDGRLWVATSYGMGLRENEQWRAFREGEGGGDGLADAAVNVIYTDRSGRVWVGSDGGLDRFFPSKNAFHRTGVSRDLATPIVWHVAESPADPGALWLATVGSGACRYVPATDETDCLRIADGLPSNVVHRIEAGDGALWLGTDRGIARLDLATRDVVTFSEADGLHGDIVDLMSSHRDADGTIRMGGPGGYTAFRPTEVRPSTFRPPVRFSQVERGSLVHRSMASGDTLRLAPSGRRFAVRFAALDYTRPRRNRYRYRLAPLETAWTETDGAAPEARYAALPPGTYTFEVVGSNHAGVFAPEPSRLHVEVPPVWWERRAVQGLLGLLVLAGVGGLGWVSVRRSERRRADAAEVARRLAGSREAERIRLARELHDGTMQHLYRVGHDLDRLATLVPEAERAEVSTVRSTLDEASDELRSVLADIRLPHVGTFGAAAAVRAAAERFQRTAPDVEVVLALDADGRRWPVEVQHAATRIVQEALANVGRHAQAASVTLRLGERGGMAEVEVADDGRGFDTHISDVAHVRGDHFGLAGLRERADALGGRAEVTSTPGTGTRVRAWLPL